MKKFLPVSKGFTLIELLVVITIIAFLAVIGAAAFGNAQKQARDGRRRADVDAIAKAYESNFAALAGTYNTLADSQFSAGKKPTDPDGSNYNTNTINIDKGFYVCSKLEVCSSTTNCGGNSTTNNALTAPATSNTGQYYCKVGQQSQ